MQTNPSATEIALFQNPVKELVRALFKRKRLVLGIFGGIVLFVTALSLLISPKYEASARLFVKPGRVENVLSTELADPSVNSQLPLTVTEKDINSEIQILASRELVGRVVTALGLDQPEESDEEPGPVAVAIGSAVGWLKSVGVLEEKDPFDKAVEELARDLEAVPLRDTDLIEVRYRDKDAELTAEVVNTVVDLYVERHLELHQTPGALELFQEQSVLLRDRLRDSEDRLETYKADVGLVSFESQREHKIELQSNLEEQLAEVRTQLAELTGQALELQDQMHAQPEVNLARSTDQRNPEVEALRQQLTELLLERTGLLATHLPTSRAVRDVDSQIATLETELEKLDEMVRSQQVYETNPLRRTLEQNLLEVEAERTAQGEKRAAIEQQLGELDTELRQMELEGAELSRLERDVKIQEEAYRLYLQRQEEARISSVMDSMRIANVSVAERAVIPTDPVFPSLPLNIAVAIVAGSLLAMGAAFLLDFFDQTLETRDEVERHLGVPLLTSIPELRARSGSS